MTLQIGAHDRLRLGKSFWIAAELRWHHDFGTTKAWFSEVGIGGPSLFTTVAFSGEIGRAF